MGGPVDPAGANDFDYQDPRLRKALLAALGGQPLSWNPDTEQLVDGAVRPRPDAGNEMDRALDAARGSGQAAAVPPGPMAKPAAALGAMASGGAMPPPEQSQTQADAARAENVGPADLAGIGIKKHQPGAGEWLLQQEANRKQQRLNPAPTPAGEAQLADLTDAAKERTRGDAANAEMAASREQSIADAGPPEDPRFAAIGDAWKNRPKGPNFIAMLADHLLGGAPAEQSAAPIAPDKAAAGGDWEGSAGVMTKGTGNNLRGPPPNVSVGYATPVKVANALQVQGHGAPSPGNADTMLAAAPPGGPSKPAAALGQMAAGAAPPAAKPDPLALALEYANRGRFINALGDAGRTMIGRGGQNAGLEQMAEAPLQGYQLKQKEQADELKQALELAKERLGIKKETETEARDTRRMTETERHDRETEKKFGGLMGGLAAQRLQDNEEKTLQGKVERATKAFGPFSDYADAISRLEGVLAKPEGQIEGIGRLEGPLATMDILSSDDAVANRQALATIGNKILKQESGSQVTPSEAERKSIETGMGKFATEKQFRIGAQAVIKVLKRGGANARAAFDPKTLQTIESRGGFVPGDQTATPAAPGGPPRISSDAEWAALPPGAEYIAPDGKHKRKR